jgi:hypothetical protein
MPFSGKGQDIDRRAIADQNGRYRLGSLTGGTHALLCAREGYTSEVLDVEAGRDDVDFVLTRAGTLAATVTDAETGAAVAEFEAELLPGTAAEESDGTGRPLYAAGPEGMLEASGLSPGAYRLLVRSRGRLTQVSPVEVRSGETARVEIALHRGAEIAGVVVDARGLPVARAILRATALAGKPEETAASPDRRSPREYSAEDGTFRITGLADGLYRVEARHSRYATGKSAPVAAARGPGAPAADVRIVLPDRQ